MTRGVEHPRVTDQHVAKMDELIKKDRRVTVDTISAAVGLSHGKVHAIIGDTLKFRAVCAQRVPHKRTMKSRSACATGSNSSQRFFTSMALCDQCHNVLNA
ncbi:hypothetical protein AVEN_36482-1 [Araneus ventricosus]|uniref:Mos1 transposase HTH domain-containing protein n=1 Tax=Araneus ventricosus TaxID=182803 RepID=A0A4Y2STF1_ARAVE|nr:hypothetical protein AVEN_36482-1 [Araneus ventricosus]